MPADATDGTLSAPTGTAAGPNRYPVTFTGQAGEYFRIWIVNLTLTIITLGIYSAWAKVRRRRYFYGNTLIDGEPFEYHGQPVAILKGRLIAVAIIAAGSVTSNVSHIAAVLISILQGIAFPWLLVRSIAFNSRNSSHRGLRFSFNGRWTEQLKIFVVGGFSTIITLGAAYPFMKAQLLRFSFNHHAYGRTAFSLNLNARTLYGIYLKGALLAFGGSFVIVLVSLLVKLAMQSSTGAMKDEAGFLAAVLTLGVPAIYLILLSYFAVVTAGLTNATWNALEVGSVRFESTLRAGRLLWIYFTNALGVLVTLGLAIPWATIRSTRYRAECLTLICHGSLADFTALSTPEVSPTGEAIADLLDFDIGL